MTDEADGVHGGDGEPGAGGETAGDDEGDVDDEELRAHLADVEDGAGCAEIWERIAEHREDDERSPAADEN
jgi:hypothetical protein